MAAEALKFVIVGHVDHGKSTLIGRLLFDTGSLPEGRIEEIRKLCASLGKGLEFGYVMDNLEEERDQGITIDTAQVFFRGGERDYVIIDAPGHVEFIKNMVTGASQADAAVLIVDAAEGAREQTRRHAYLLGLLGIGQVIVAVNKMDLAGYGRDRYEAIRSELSSFLERVRITPTHIIPISARQGDMVAQRGPNMGWYGGPTLLEALDGLRPAAGAADMPLRFVVQDVYSFGRRIAVGRVESGTLRVGDAVRVLPTGETTRIASLEEYGKSPTAAEAGKCIGITTVDKVFVDRGFVVAGVDDAPAVTDTIRATIFWMDRTPLAKGMAVRLRCGTQEVPCEIGEILRVVDSSTLEPAAGASEVRNREVAEVTIRALKPLVVDPYGKIRPTGRFVLAGEGVMAGGIVTKVGP